MQIDSSVEKTANMKKELYTLENIMNMNEVQKFYKKLKGQIQGLKSLNNSKYYSKLVLERIKLTQTTEVSVL